MAKQSKKEYQKQKEARTKKAMYTGVCIALFLVGLTGVLIWFLNYSPNLSVVKVNEYEYKKDMYTCVYYYNTMVAKDWKSEGFDVTKDPYEQPFSGDESQYETWGDYFQSLTENTLRYFTAMTDIAEKGGYTYTAEVENAAKAELDGILNSKNPAVTFTDYMLQNYGAPIQKRVLESYLQLYYRSTYFYKDITHSKALFNKYIGGNASTFEEIYEKHRDEIDVVTFRYYALENTAQNEDKIDALEHAHSPEEFKQLCDTYENKETYTQNDSSLYENISISQMKNVVQNHISVGLCDANTETGDVLVNVYEKNGKEYKEIVYVVQARGKDTSAYDESDVQKWEFSAMSLMLETEYENYKTEVLERGINEFKKTMVIPAGSDA